MVIFLGLPVCVCWLFCSLSVLPTEAKHFKRHPVYGRGYKMNTSGFKTKQVPTAIKCAGYCAVEVDCIAFQMGKTDRGGMRECQHFRSFRVSNASVTKVARSYSFFVQHFEAGTEPYLKGMSPTRAVMTCKELPTFNPSGVYWIDPDGGSRDNAFEAYCDMDTAGGGWTLVYSYTFTKYNSFQILSNAVTPIPNWPLPLSQGLVNISTEPPLGESQDGAVDFSLWQLLGSDVLVKSNINHWVKCQPIVGSLVTMTSGIINCTQVKSVTGNISCSNMLTHPVRFDIDTNGPVIKFNHNKSPFGILYYWDGSTTQNWPTHDPCGVDTTSHVHGLVEPRGTIYIK